MRDEGERSGAGKSADIGAVSPPSHVASLALRAFATPPLACVRGGLNTIDEAVSHRALGRRGGHEPAHLHAPLQGGDRADVGPRNLQALRIAGEAVLAGA